MTISRTLSLIATALALSAVPGVMSALESPAAVGPRALGMGGVGVACSDDTVAQYYNPATFGFFSYPDSNDEGDIAASDNQHLRRKSWGFGIDATVGARTTGEIGTYVQEILDIDFEQVEALGQAGNLDAATLQSLVKALRAVSRFDEKSDSVLADVTTGAALRIGHFGIGARVYSQAMGKLKDLDTQRLGLDLPGGNTVADQLNNINTGVNTTPGSYTPTTLTPTQQSQLQTTLVNQGASTTAAQQAVNQLDVTIAQAGIPLDQVDGIISQFDNLVANSGVNGLLFGDNLTKLRLVGLALAEVPVSYGYAFNDHLSIGGSLKYMLGRVYGTDVQLLNDDTGKEFKDYLDDAQDNSRQSSAVGIDLGIQARFPWIQLGATGRNLNAPKFKGPKVGGIALDDIRVDPTVMVGAAIIPSEYVTVAADADVLKSESLLPGYDSQRIKAGAELSLFHVVDLRAGVSKNIAESDIPVLYSAGLGLNLWLVRIDAAGQATTKTVEVDGKEVPQEFRGSIALATDW